MSEEKNKVIYEDREMELLERQAHYPTRIDLFKKARELQELVKRASKKLNELKNLMPSDRPPEKKEEYKDYMETELRLLVQFTEHIALLLPDLIAEEWYRDFHRRYASMNWRMQEGTYDYRRLWEIRKNVDRLDENLHDFLFERPRGLPCISLQDHQTIQDIQEVYDLFALNHFSTGFFVLGRALDRLVFEIGDLMGITEVDGKYWDDDYTSLNQRSLALKKVSFGGEEILNKEEAKLISLLRVYRNKCAHEEYQHVEQKKARRRAKDALDLIKKFDDITSDLRELPEEDRPEKGSIDINH